MPLDLITFADKEGTPSDYPANRLIRDVDANEIKTVTNAAVAAVNTLLEVPANYLPGFPGGSALDLVTFVYAAIGTATPATKAATPTSFAAGTPTSSTVPLSWAGPTGAAYVVQRATNSGFSAGLVTIYTGANTNVTNSSGLSASTLYYYRVKAQVAGLDDSDWATLQATTAAVATPAPTITGFTPSSGLVSSSIVITGANFTGATVVSINSGAVQGFVVNSATQITATLTNAQTSGLVRVTTPAGTAVSSGSFTVTTGGAAPTLPDVSRFLFFSTADATGNTAASWKDLSGKNNHLTSTTGLAYTVDRDNRPVYRSDYGPTFNGGFATSFANNGASGITAYALLDIFDPSAAYLFGGGSFFLGLNYPELGAYYDGAVHGTLTAQGLAQLLVFRLNPATNTGEVFLNDGTVPIYTGTFAQVALTAGMHLGANPASGDYAVRGAWHAFGIRAGVDTDQQIADMTAYLQAYYAYVPAAPTYDNRPVGVTWPGNSRPFGIEEVQAAPPLLLGNALGSNFIVLNKGEGGDVMQSLFNRLPAIVAEYDRSAHFDEYLLFLDLVNDETLNSRSASVATILADHDAFLRRMHYRGYRVIDGTTITSIQSDTTRLNALNTGVLNGMASSKAEAVADYAGITQMQNYTNTDTFDSGGLHFTVLGNTYVAKKAHTTLTPLFTTHGIPFPAYTWGI